MAPPGSLIHVKVSPAIAGDEGTGKEGDMDRQHDDSRSVDPKAPHAYKERMNLPYNIPKSMGPGIGTGLELPFRKAEAPDDCELCGKRLSDPIHAASEQAADEEHWPV